jgi:VanZ family protein
MNPPDVPEDLRVSNFDKFVHFLMFLALSGIVFFDNTGYFKQRTSLNRIVFGSFFFPTLFSGFIELLQEFLSSTRSGDWLDFLFDGIGVFVGIIICFLINSKLKFTSKSGQTLKN